ncbi:MAG: dipeptidase [Desulfovibrionaceae bacterium]
MPAPIFDGHVDLLHHLRFKHSGAPFNRVEDGQLSLAKLEQANVRIFLSAYFLPDASLAPSVHISLDDAIDYCDRNAPEIKPVANAAELRAAFSHEGGPLCAIRLLENSDQLLEYDLDAFTAQHFKVAGLTHFGQNRLAAGDRVDPAHGLSAAGRGLLPRLAARRIILDAAHLNETSFFQALDAFEGAVLCSHTGFRAFHDTPRNLSEEQLSAIIERGGVVGVTVAPEILSASGAAGLADVVRAIDWAVQRHGPRHIALGSDFGGFDRVCRGLEHIGLLPDLAAGLAALGYDPASVAGIMGRNWLEFFEKNW